MILAVLAVTTALGVSFAATFAHASYLSLDLPELQTLTVLIAAFGLWPLAQPDEGAPPARLVGPILILAGLAATAAVRLNHPYDARHPEATDVVYQVDQDRKQAWRVSVLPALAPWSAEVLKTGGAALTKLESWRFNGPVDAAAAPYVDYPPAQIALAKGANGDVTLHVVPPAGARTIGLHLSSNTVAAVTAIGGAATQLPIPPTKSAAFSVAAPPAEGFDVTVHPAGPGKLTVDYAAVLDDWPKAAAPLPKRPANVMPFDTSDGTVLTGTRSLSW
ncbi:MAG: hypothetical protein JSR98_08735 [Proteobacteria bacterium]|nr:hypothetical protein [Pseudomonadota bacterium]